MDVVNVIQYEADVHIHCQSPIPGHVIFYTFLYLAFICTELPFNVLFSLFKIVCIVKYKIHIRMYLHSALLLHWIRIGAGQV